ncbi:MAG: ABC transporter substrate-binding protein, partial [Actinobacteria bacterium]|nr:ABC transporter substrate-binding protein [Actinomycetota bacterium]
MSRMRSGPFAALAVAVVLVAGACSGGGEGDTGDVTVDIGVDAQSKVIRIGALNDVSGPAAVIGKPFALGKQILVNQINAGGSGLLPEGWTIELIERDHGYNPGSSVQYYNEVKDQVLFFATSFGTPNTLPLQPLLEQDGIVAFPASLSSAMAENQYTPPIGTPYSLEAMRAMDFAVEDAGGAANVRAAIVYQQDDYGADGLAGWRQAAEHHGIQIVSEQEVTPTQSDFTATVTALQGAGANYVMLTTLPTATISILGTAAGLGFEPAWLGNTPSWVDAFSNPEILPIAARDTYYWISSLPVWRESLPGIDAFHGAFERFAAEEATPNFYILASYIQGLVEIEAARRAIEGGDISRAGYLE